MFNCTKATALALLTAMTISLVPATAFAETNGEGDVIGPGAVEASGDGWDTVQSGDQDQTPGTPDSQTPDTPVVPADPTTPEEPDTPVVPADQQASGQDEQTPANAGTTDQNVDTQTPEPAEPEEPVIVDPFDLIPVAEGEWGTTNDGKKCFVDTQGNIVTGLVRIENKIYFFDLETGVMATGWKTFEDGAKRYFLSDGSAVVSTWYTISKVKYYFDDIGIMATGLQKINGKYYYFDTNGKPKTGWITVGNVKYYFGSDYVGYMNKWLTYNKHKYYFNSEARMVNYLYKIGGKLYFFDSSGRRCTGWITYYGIKYYFYSDGHGAVNSWLTYKKEKYYFNSEGKMVTGLQKIGGKQYYFNIYGKRRTGWITLGNNKYYFYSDGHGAVNAWVTYKKEKYYFDSEGKMVTGVQKISGKLYYFNIYGKRRTGWITYGANTYYFKPSDGTACVNQWYTISKKKYFFDENGVRLTGIAEAKGHLYMFTSAGVLTSGFASMEGGRVYFTTTNGIVSGWQVINNKSYYFDRDTHFMVYGTKVIDGKTYYFNDEGVLQKTGWFTCEDGTKYYLENGVPKCNAWVTDASGNKFYMGADGHMLIGQHTIGKNIYYFYDNGRMAKDVTIAGYHYNKSGVMDYKRVDASDVSWHAKDYGSYPIGTKEADDNATLIASQLMLDFGWTFEACCGLLGNITYEGGFNPWQWEIAYTKKLNRLPTMEEARTTGYGYGLIGWTGARKYIFNNATTKGVQYFPNYNQESYSGYGPNFYDCPGDPNDGRAQTKLIGVAMSRGNGNIWVKRKKVTQQEFTKLTSVEDAALYWLWNAEYPASLTTSAYQNTENRRITAAKTWYDRLGGATFVPIKVT